MKKYAGIKIADVILMLLILASAAAFFVLPLFNDRAKTAEIFLAETDEKHIIPLGVDKEYEVISRDAELVVRVENGEVSVARSTCRDGICKNTPPVSRVGESIVCAPAGVVVRVLGEEAHVDGVSG